MDAAAQVPLYATFARRFRALVLDSAVFAVLLLLVVIVTSTVRFSQPVRLALFAACIGGAILYEPVQVAIKGATIGQQLSNLRVVAPSATGRLPLWKAFLRWLLKGATGLASFATMGFTRRNQALHDLPFGTTVQIANPARARAQDYILERVETVGGSLPSRRRRVVVIAAYLVLMAPLVGTIMALGASQDCLERDHCAPGENIWVRIVSTAWMATIVAVGTLGWKGRLPGIQPGDAEASISADPSRVARTEAMAAGPDAARERGLRRGRWGILMVLLVAGSHQPRVVTAQTVFKSGVASQLPHLDGHLLLARVDTFVVYAVEGDDSSRVGEVEDQLTVRGDSLVRVYSEVLPNWGVHYDTMVAVLSDLRPRSFDARSTVRETHLIYDSTTIKGWIREKRRVGEGADSHSVAITLSSPVYEGVNVDLIARASPLTRALQVSIPAFIYGTRTITTVRGGVVGEADISGHPCWIFYVAFPESPYTLWIDKTNRVTRRIFVQYEKSGGLLYLNRSL